MSSPAGSDSPAQRLRELGGTARKRFGQHFLASPGIVKGILALARVGEGSPVLEIGPGLGALTEPMMARGVALQCVELDRDLAAFLRERHPQLMIHEADAAKVVWSELLAGAPPHTVVANLPYNVGTRILTRLLDHPQHFDRLVIMVQKEVAQRLVAPAGDRKRGSLSVYVQARAELRLGLHVPRGAFHPPPKVESAVVVLSLRPHPDLVGVPLPALEEVVRAAFKQPRKMVRGTLGVHFGKARAAAALEAAGVSPTARPQTLNMAAWGSLCLALGGLVQDPGAI